MSDVAETSERALRALREESSGSGLLNAKIERTPTPPVRPSSPEQPCPICLGEINDKAVTDSCLHRFCFTCLCEWSKVKPECPLCKQRFTTIYHAIKSISDFQEYRLDQPRASQGMELGDLVSPIYINVAVQRQRFGYRTTMGLNRSGRHPLAVYWPASGPIPHPPVHHSMRVSIPGPPVSHASTSSSTQSAMQQRAASTEFRRNVYRQNLWARANPNQDRVRESSPDFYRTNIAQTHRLAPWLARELSVLLDVGVNFCMELACRDILNGITMYPINSFEFKRLVTPYFGDRTNHFVHEFYHFAISPFDMHGYDVQARYTPSNAELETRNYDENEDENAPDVSEIPLSGSIDPHQFFMGFGDISGRPSGIPLSRPPRDLRSSRDIGTSIRGMDRLIPLSLRLRTAVQSTMSTVSSEVIELSSGEENAADDNEDSDSEVLIIGSLPPRHLRTPEVITLDDSDDSDVIEIKPPTPPLIEIDDDSESHSPSRPSTSNGIAGSSTSQVPEAYSKRTARFFRPSYREYSSSSEEEAIPPKKRTTRKNNESKRSTRSSSRRTRSIKSSKFVDTASSDSNDLIDEVKDEDTGKKASKRKTKNVRKTAKSVMSQSDQEDVVGISKRSVSSNSRSSSKKSLGTDSDSCKSCSKCSNSRKKRKNLTSSSDSENTDRRPPKRKSKTSHSECSGSTKMEPHSPTTVDVVGDEPVQNGGNYGRNPKALSRKAILLGRNAEASDNTMDNTISLNMSFAPSRNSAFHIPGGRYSRTDSERLGKDWHQEGTSDSNSSTLSMGKEFLPSENGYDGQPDACPPDEPRSPSSMSRSSTSSSSRRHYLDPPPESNDTWPALPPRDASSSNSSPAITLDHSPLMSPRQLDDTTWDSSAASPPRLKSIVLRVPSPNGDRKCSLPSTASHHSSASPSSGDDDDDV